MKFMRRAAVLSIAAAIVPFSPVQPVRSAEGFSPDRMAWKLTITPEKFEKYVDFPTTQIGSVIRVSVFHESTEAGKSGKPTHYKNYYFDREAKLLGSKQVTPVTFPSDTRGPILVKRGPAGTTPAISTAAANVAVRLYLDLYTSKNFPQFIVVDDDMFNDFIDGVKRAGFKPFTIPRSRDIQPKPKAIMVLKSDRGDKFQYMMYQ
jgi:hypothetical protein